jgi:SOS response regulatory protein OraA/RecX
VIIKKISKTGLFYKVHFDNDASYKFHESVIIKYGFLRKKIEVDEEKLACALKDNEYYLALDKGVKYLMVPHAIYEAKMYLSKYFDNEIVSKVLEKLLELKLLNDKEYAKYYTQIGIKKLYGPNKIIDDLITLKVLKEYILEALDEYDKETELINCLKVLDKYIPTLKKSSKSLGKKKLANYLINKGFSNDIITISIEKNGEILDNICDEDKLLEAAYIKLLRNKKTLSDKEFKAKAIRSLTNKGFSLSQVLKFLESRATV